MLQGFQLSLSMGSEHSDLIAKKNRHHQGSNMSLRLRKWIIEGLLTVFFATVVVTGYNLYLQRDMPKGLAPQMTKALISGSEIDLIQLSHSKPVLVYFWASWCRVCQWTSPAVNDIANTYADDFDVISVALASGNNQRIAAYLEAKELNMPVINDNDGVISRHWSVSVTPSFFIIREGEIRSVTTGFTTKVGLLIRLFFNR